MKRKIISVWEVNHYVSELLEQDYMLNDLWILGEVSNCKYHHSGHIYFTIKDEKASMNAVMFARDAAHLTFKLIEGMRIYARARMTIYEKTGGYQAYVYDIEKQGKGMLYEKFEELKARLDKEGLFDPKYKKMIPPFPKKVGIITSSTGAAIRDIVQVSKRRNPSISLYIYPTHVQGEFAVAEITQAIQKANQDNLVDVIILGRGGGSIEDLWAFNEEQVARAIFTSNIPIVSAVGHEIDFTISDFVSDKRAATPSAAAEMVCPSKDEIQQQVQRYRNTLNYMIRHNINASKGKLESLISRPIYQTKDKFYKDKMQQVDILMYKLDSEYKNKLKYSFNTCELLLQQLEKLSPFNTLKRGYSFVTNDQDKMITSVKDVKHEDKLYITVSDGVFTAKVCKEEK